MQRLGAAAHDEMARLAPYGIGNPRPVFLSEGAEIAAAPQVLQGKHLKLLVRQSGRTLEAIAWNKAPWAGTLAKGGRVDLAFTLQTSTYQGEEKLYLGLEGVRA